MSSYREVKKIIENLSDMMGIPKPEISKSRNTDPCDVTDPPYIRIRPVRCLDSLYHATHVLGHYLADWHSANEYAESDEIADIIGKLIRNYYNSKLL